MSFNVPMLPFDSAAFSFFWVFRKVHTINFGLIFIAFLGYRWNSFISISFHSSYPGLKSVSFCVFRVIDLGTKRFYWDENYLTLLLLIKLMHSTDPYSLFDVLASIITLCENSFSSSVSLCLKANVFETNHLLYVSLSIVLLHLHVKTYHSTFCVWTFRLL